jgi:mannan endo-1,4-beta-mannosidase
VRIVWCADTLIRVGRCEEKDIHPVEELENVLSLVKSQRLVAMLNLQNATGSDSAEHLQNMVEYLVSPDVKRILLEYKDYVLINIANEWYGTWDKTSNFLEGYRKAVRDLRNAGLSHVLIVDARGYGQDISSIADHGQDLVSLDGNLMISAHLYDVFRTPSSVANVFSMVREKKLPFLIGEFGCTHGADKPVACEAILAEASRGERQYGYIGWSFSGNGSSLRDLDIVEFRDWSTLTAWGRTLINSPGGIKSTSKEACFYRAPIPCSP